VVNKRIEDQWAPVHPHAIKMGNPFAIDRDGTRMVMA
jgi:hypothetical protein